MGEGRHMAFQLFIYYVPLTSKDSGLQTEKMSLSWTSLFKSRSGREHFVGFFLFLKSILNHVPINGFEKGFDIICTFEPVINHECMFKNIHNKKRYAACKMTNIMFIDPGIE